MTHQIIEVPDISVVKTINGEKQLLSLRDQKLVKDGALQHIGPGSGVMYSGDMYVLDQGRIRIARMITNGNSLSFRVSRKNDITVDWGDGSVEVNVFEHSYTDNAEKHIIEFYGLRNALEDLLCNDNQLSDLEIGYNSGLQYLDCYNNQLSSMDVSYNPQLTYISCHSNQLSTLDISRTPALQYLFCDKNQFLTFDISHNPRLVHFNCSDNQITTLDINHNPAIEIFQCGNNQLLTLDVTHNSLLTYFLCGKNQLHSLDVSQNKALKYLYCDVNQLATLNLSENILLEILYCSDNPFIHNSNELHNMVNSLIDRTGIKPGEIGGLSAEAIEVIQEVCTVKNWKIV